MKIRESGMPEQEFWASFFDVETILDRLHLLPGTGDIVEFGCGYGTFTVAAARRSVGVVHALDIDPTMVQTTTEQAYRAGVANVRASERDFVAAGTGLPDGSVAYAMLFNILHAEEPLRLLGEAYRVLAPGGIVGVIHWNYDPSTPRGPSMDIRPRSDACRRWTQAAGLELGPLIDLPPYHYGFTGTKPPPANVGVSHPQNVSGP